MSIKKIEDKLFGYEPNWIQPFNLSYDFFTVLSSGRLQNEQRKSMNIRPQRRIEMTVLLESDQMMDMLSWLSRYSLLETWQHVPIFSEPIIPDETGDMTALTTVATKDIEHFKNIQDYTTEVVFIDRSWTIRPKVKNLASAGTSSITLDSALGTSFIGERTIIYPIMRGVILEHRFSHVTDKWFWLTLNILEELNEDTIVGIGAS